MLTSVASACGDYLTFVYTKLNRYLLSAGSLTLRVKFLQLLSVVIADCVSLQRLHLSEDVAGATFMAAGSSAPELFTSVIGKEPPASSQNLHLSLFSELKWDCCLPARFVIIPPGCTWH